MRFCPVGEPISGRFFTQVHCKILRIFDFEFVRIYVHQHVHQPDGLRGDELRRPDELHEDELERPQSPLGGIGGKSCTFSSSWCGEIFSFGFELIQDQRRRGRRFIFIAGFELTNSDFALINSDFALINSDFALTNSDLGPEIRGKKRRRSTDGKEFGKKLRRRNVGKKFGKKWRRSKDIVQRQ